MIDNNGSSLLRMPLDSFHMLGVLLDLAWNSRPSRVAVFHANDLPLKLDFYTPIVARLEALRRLSVNGGWLFSEECIPLKDFEFLAPPQCITFSSDMDSNASMSVIGLPENSQKEVERLIAICTDNLYRLGSLATEPYANYALHYSANLYARLYQADILDKDKIKSVFFDFPRNIGFSTIFSDSLNSEFISIPIFSFSQHDETEQMLYFDSDFLLNTNTFLGAILRKSLQKSEPLEIKLIHPPEHLGGHKWRTNLDIGALDAITHLFPINSMVDVGCGPGGMVAYAKWKGIHAIGIDGDPQIPADPSILQHDFSISPIACPLSCIDLIWCVEFLEHLDEKFLNNLIPLLSQSSVIFSTAAPPGQDGHHHVNCKPHDYWIQWFEKIGFYEEESATKFVRKKSSMRSNFTRTTGTVFVKK